MPPFSIVFIYLNVVLFSFFFLFCVFFLFILWVLVFCSHLRRCNRLLGVVVAQASLQVEDAQRLTLLEVARGVEQESQRRISVDGVLVHQLVLLGVGGDTLGDLGAADLSARGVAQELVQRIRHVLGDLERSGALGHIIRTSLGLAVLAALARILDGALDLLLQTLHLSEQRGDGVAHRGQVASQASEVIVPRGLGGISGRGRGGDGLSSGGDRRRGLRRSDGGDGGLLDGLGLGRRSSGLRHRGRRRRSNRRLRSGGLGNLGDGLLGGGGGTHCTGGWDTIHLKFTH